MSILKNKTCLVTGASRGIGKEIVSLLKKEECKILGVSSKDGDLGTDKGIMKIINLANKKLKKVDILINNAGIYLNKPIYKCKIDEFDKIFNINVKAPWILSGYYCQNMKKQKWGRIVNIGSLASYHGHMNQTLYNASKHALLGMSRCLFKELNDYNVRVFIVSPAGVQTDMGIECLGNQKIETFLDPKEVAKYIVFNLKFNKQLISTEIHLNRMYIERLEKVM